MEKDAEHRKAGGSERGLRVFYAPRENSTPEGERAALAAIYAAVLHRHDSKKAVHGDEVEEGIDHGDD